MTRRYTNEKLLKYMKEFYIEFGRVPTQYDFMNSSEYPNFGTYVNRFGSWNNALKMAELEVNKIHHSYSDDELLETLERFYKEKGKVPSASDFNGDKKYPNHHVYEGHFGSWNNALRLVGLDMDTLVKKGLVNIESCESLKGRLFEILVRDSFKFKSVDLSGDNPKSPFDGLCPRGKIYDAKSSRLLKYNSEWKGWSFSLSNKEIERLDYAYLGAFNKDYSILLYVWLVPGILLTRKRNFIVGASAGEFNLKNMKKYEITDRCNIELINKDAKIEDILIKEDIITEEKKEFKQQNKVEFKKKVFKIRSEIKVLKEEIIKIDY